MYFAGEVVLKEPATTINTVVLNSHRETPLPPPPGRVVIGFLLVLALAFLAGCSTTDEPTLNAAAEQDEMLTAADTESTTTTAGAMVVEVPSDNAPDDPANSTTTSAPPATSAPPLVVFDTDLGADVDDVLALAMLHAYADRGMAEIAAVTISRNSTVAARYADAVNTFYGRPDIPVGIHKNSIIDFNDDFMYTSEVDSWPHDLTDAEVPDGAALLRQVLVDAEAAGRKVVIIQTGFSGNLADLLDSGGDATTPRNGVDLVADTVSLLSIMAGAADPGMVEFNVEKDIASAQRVFADWPTAMVVSPFELGYNILYPYSSITSDFGWIDRHPVREAYEFSDLGWHEDAPPFYNMRSWDLTSVMQALEPDASFFFTSDPGRMTVANDGRTTFAPGASDGSRVDIVLDRGTEYSQAEKQRVIDRMIELTSSQPQP